MRVLAVTSPARLIAAPELPTAAEAGLPGLTARNSLGLLAPAGTPKEIIEQIARATHAALAEPAFQQTLIEFGFRARSRFEPRKVPTYARRRHCSLDADRPGAWGEDRLIAWVAD